MMRPLHSPFIGITAMTFVMLTAAGCGTPAATGRPHTSFTGDKEVSSPFLQREDYTDRLGLALQDVLSNHRFSIPWVVVRGSESSTWFVAERFESSHRFDRVYVHVMSDERVTTSITAYQFGPSDWAILGRLFVDVGPEAKVIAAEITKKLSDETHAVR
jgi:hypothetical protein